MSDIQLNSSQLGTREYWNNFYKREVDNFAHNEEDTGECWFDDSDAESKMVRFIVDKLEQGSLPAPNGTTSFLDLGTGNGHLLFSLHEELEEECVQGQFSFTGVDYSPDSVEFARKILEKKYNSSPSFSFEQVDLLAKECGFLANKFDVLLDKGTLDAIALNQDPLEDFGGKRGMDVYADQVAKMMKQGSVLLITSCNFTEEELVRVIVGDGSRGLRVWDRIDYPSFSFGGVKGSTICTVAFEKSL